MKTTISILFILILGVIQASFAQDTAALEKSILWTVDKNCASKNFSDEDKTKITCDEITRDGDRIRIISYKGTTFALALADDGDYLVADVLAVNATKERFLIDPAHCFLSAWKTADAKGGAEFFDHIPPSKIEAKIKSRAKWKNFFNSLGSAMQKETFTVNAWSYENGFSTATVSVPDKQAQRNAERANAARSDEAYYNAEMINSTALKANTLLPGQYINGLVYFKRKRMPVILYSILLNDVFFEFSFNGSK